MVSHTFPGAAVDFDSHADSSLVSTVRDETHATGNDWWFHITEDSNVRVLVSTKQLEREKKNTTSDLTT